jgi:hypothetical protein
MTGILLGMAPARGVLSARFDKYGCDSNMIEFHVQAMRLEKVTINHRISGQYLKL